MNFKLGINQTVYYKLYLEWEQAKSPYEQWKYKKHQKIVLRNHRPVKFKAIQIIETTFLSKY